MSDFLNPDIPMMPSDMFSHLSTHPEAVSPAVRAQESFIHQARYRMFDLTVPEQVQDLEEIVSCIMRREKVLRQEKWSHDKEGNTTVTLAWFDLIERRPSKKKAKTDKDLADEKGPWKDDDEVQGSGSVDPI